MQIFFNGAKRTVTQAYNGKRHKCMCGCAGNYAKPDSVDDAYKMAARIRKIERFIGPMRPEAANFGDAASYSNEPFNNIQYVYIDEGDRTTCVYFKA